MPTFATVLVASAVLRVLLILYSEYHDARSAVKYTDVDYRVFSDATQFLLNSGPGESNVARGVLGEWLCLGDPYKRETYRYTPLLALLLAPNVWVHPSFGKYLFAACDILNGILIHNLLVTIILPALQGSNTVAKSTQDEKASSRLHYNLATIYSAVHLLNPLVFTISTRGSSESVLASLVLLTLYYALKGRWNSAAILLGISAHWKIYPVIYGVACLGVVGSQGVAYAPGWNGYLRTLVNLRAIRFAAVSAATFLTLGAACYAVWGYPFLYESYFYHIHRLDHRHNFSPYFYLTYLTYPESGATPAVAQLPLWQRLLRSPLTSFVPQMSLTLGTGLLFGRRREDLTFAWFVQTFIFVLFNKVCTSQYFLWYLLFVPLLLPSLKLSPTRGVIYLLIWFGSQALWLAEAYKLEFLGEDVFLSLWLRGCIYVLSNAWVLKGVMDAYQPPSP